MCSLDDVSVPGKVYSRFSPVYSIPSPSCSSLTQETCNRSMPAFPTIRLGQKATSGVVTKSQGTSVSQRARSRCGRGAMQPNPQG